MGLTLPCKAEVCSEKFGRARAGLNFKPRSGRMSPWWYPWWEPLCWYQGFLQLGFSLSPDPSV